MPQPTLSSARSQTSYVEPPITMPAGLEAQASGVSWPAVIGGAFVTAALSLILLALGTGLGLASVSPWANVGASAATVSVAAIIWLIAMQIISAAMGGYLAGRLRTKWASIHTDEVYFRDTAHGFLSWAVAFVVTAAFLTTAATFMVGAAASGAASGAAAAPRSPTAMRTATLSIRCSAPRCRRQARTSRRRVPRPPAFLRILSGRGMCRLQTGSILVSWLPRGRDSARPRPTNAWLTC